jgi:hypothetical protein
MAMGDGVLHINYLYAKAMIDDNINIGKTVAWKYGDKIENRPKSVKFYLKDNFDKFRSTMYHEFGHHIHQMKYITPTTKDMLGRVIGDRGFIPEIEEKVRKIVRTEKRKSGLIGNSTYGDTNPEEWFAEQFSAYSLGLADKVHPEFKKLIKEIEDEVGR